MEPTKSLMAGPEFILAALAASKGATHSPVQVQKLFFLLDRKLAGEVGGPYFNFTAYHYGPFDRTIYDLLERLAEQGFVEISSNPALRYRTYRLTPEGQRVGGTFLNQLDQHIVDYMGKLSDFVRGLSFAELVSAIYAAYPEMKVNSVFRELYT